MLIYPFHSSLNQLISGKFLCRSLLLSTGWLLCDLSMNQVLAKATPDTALKEHSESVDEKHSDSDKDSDKKENSEEDKTKEEKAKDEAFKPVYSKDMYNVLNMPESAIYDFKAITKKIFAKKDQGHTDTLNGAMRSAYETNPDIKTQRAALRATDEGVVQAKAGWRPTLNGTLSGQLARNKVNGQLRRAGENSSDSASSDLKSGTQTAQVQLQQNLFQGGNTVYSTRAATAAVKAGRADLERQVQLTLLDSAQAYLNLLAQYASLQYLLDYENISKKGLEQNMAKAEVGDETRTTVAQSEFEYVSAVGRRVAAEAELEGLKADYEKVINKKAGNLVVPDFPEIPNTLEAVLDRVRLNNPQIIKAQFEEVNARHTVDINQSFLLPKIDLTASSSANIYRNKDAKRFQADTLDKGKTFNDKTVNNQVNLSMTIPLYEAGTTRSRTRQAAETASQKRIQIETVRREVLDKAARAWSLYVSAKENRIVYKDQMKAADASVEGVRQEVEVGAKAYIDFINETRRLIEAQQNYVLAEKGYLLSAFEVLYWMGALTPTGQSLKVEVYDPKIHYDEVKNKI